MKKTKEITKEEAELQLKKEREILKFKENPFEIPKYMSEEFVYSTSIKEAEHLIPSKELVEKAFKNLVERYIEKIKKNGYSKTLTMSYSNIEVVGRSVLYREFCYKTKKENMDENTISHFGNQFVLTEAYDFKKKVGLINERKTFSMMAGWRYRENYDSFINQYSLKKHSEGSFWRFNSEYEESIKKLKINDYYTYEAKAERLSYLCKLNWFQQVLDQDPGMTEVLFKMGYENLVHRKISKQKYDFLRKNKKSLPKTIEKEDFDLAFSIFKAGKDPKDFQMVRDTFGKTIFGHNTKRINRFCELKYDLKNLKENETISSYEYSEKFKKSFSSVNAKVLYRVINLLNAGSTWEELNHFCGCCYALELNQNEYIFKGKKEREEIISEFEKRKSEKIIEKRKKELELKRKERQTLEETTKDFKELTVNGFLLKPLKTYKDFQETATKFRNCLITNDFHSSVAKGAKIIYLAIPLDKKEIDGEIICWKRSDRLTVEQIHGVQNKNTIYYEEIKKIAEAIKLEELLIVTN